MNAAFHQLCVQPEGQERRDLLAMQGMLNEAIRDIRILKKAEAAREQVQKKLRGEL